MNNSNSQKRPFEDQDNNDKKEGEKIKPKQQHLDKEGEKLLSDFFGTLGKEEEKKEERTKI